MENSPEPTTGGEPPPAQEEASDGGPTLGPALARLPVASFSCDGAGRIEDFDPAAGELLGDAPAPAAPSGKRRTAS